MKVVIFLLLIQFSLDSIYSQNIFKYVNSYNEFSLQSAKNMLDSSNFFEINLDNSEKSDHVSKIYNLKPNIIRFEVVDAEVYLFKCDESGIQYIPLVLIDSDTIANQGFFIVRRNSLVYFSFKSESNELFEYPFGDYLKVNLSQLYSISLINSEFKIDATFLYENDKPIYLLKGFTSNQIDKLAISYYYNNNLEVSDKLFQDISNIELSKIVPISSINTSKNNKYTRYLWLFDNKFRIHDCPVD